MFVLDVDAWKCLKTLFHKMEKNEPCFFVVHCKIWIFFCRTLVKRFVFCTLNLVRFFKTVLDMVEPRRAKLMYNKQNNLISKTSGKTLYFLRGTKHTDKSKLYGFVASLLKAA